MAKANSKKTVLINDTTDTTEVLASHIRRTAQGVRVLRRGPINDKTLIILIQHAMVTPATQKPLSQAEIRRVLDGISDLEKACLK